MARVTLPSLEVREREAPASNEALLSPATAGLAVHPPAIAGKALFTPATAVYSLFLSTNAGEVLLSPEILF